MKLIFGTSRCKWLGCFIALAFVVGGGEAHERAQAEEASAGPAAQYKAVLKFAGDNSLVEKGSNPETRLLIQTQEHDQSLISDYWIGVQCEPVEESTYSPGESPGITVSIRGGVKVNEVIPDGAAEEAGLKRGDVLLRFGNSELKSLNDVFKVVGEAETNETSIVLIRDGKMITKKITPKHRPKNEQTKIKGAYNVEQLNLPNLETAYRFVLSEKQLPEGYTLNIELKANEDIGITVKKDHLEWKVDEDEIEKLPSEIQELSTSIVESCKPYTKSQNTILWNAQSNYKNALHKAVLLEVAPTSKTKEPNVQLADVQRQLLELTKAVSQLQEEMAQNKDK